MSLTVPTYTPITYRQQYVIDYHTACGTLCSAELIHTDEIKKNFESWFDIKTDQQSKAVQTLKEFCLENVSKMVEYSFLYFMDKYDTHQNGVNPADDIVNNTIVHYPLARFHKENPGFDHQIHELSVGTGSNIDHCILMHYGKYRSLIV